MEWGRVIQVLTAQQLQEHIIERIPLARFMGVEGIYAGVDQVTLSVPLTPNCNHKGTAFGGSLTSAALLSCWGLLETLFAAWGLNAQAVVAASETKYRRPVKGDFLVVCQAPEGINEFKGTLCSRGKARVNVHSRVVVGEECAVKFRGDFYAVLRT